MPLPKEVLLKPLHKPDSRRCHAHPAARGSPYHGHQNLPSGCPNLYWLFVSYCRGCSHSIRRPISLAKTQTINPAAVQNHRLDRTSICGNIHNRDSAVGQYPTEGNSLNWKRIAF